MVVLKIDKWKHKISFDFYVLFDLQKKCDKFESNYVNVWTDYWTDDIMNVLNMLVGEVIDIFPLVF